MAQQDAFQPQGNTISLTTSAVASTAQSVQITPANLGLPAAPLGSGGIPFPPNIRIVSKGTSDIWISITIATATIVIPTPGTTTVGTPQFALILVPSSIEVWSFDPGPTMWINNISIGVSQTFHITLGEGM